VSIWLLIQTLQGINLSGGSGVGADVLQLPKLWYC
jgi:hypothetical protein